MSTLTLIKDIVKATAEELIKDNGDTTTLEVKRELRLRGFWATQDEVRRFMDEIASEENYDVQNNGQFRSFSKIISNPNSQMTVTITPRFDCKQILQLDETDITTGDWKVSSTQNQFVIYFDKKYTRDQVRCAYRLQFPMDIKYTRACKL